MLSQGPQKGINKANAGFVPNILNYAVFSHFSLEAEGFSIADSDPPGQTIHTTGWKGLVVKKMVKTVRTD